jgi:ABC-type transport system substrate-binding protein
MTGWRTLSIALTAVLVAACGEVPAPSVDTGETPSAGTTGVKVYRHSMDQAPTSLDPVQASNVYANHVALNAYDTLFSYKYLARPYTPKPNLADGWPEISDDNLVYTIRIKPGVYFIDDEAFPGGVGRELVAEDFVYSLKRQFDAANRPQGAWLWQGRIAGLDQWKENGSDYDEPVEGLRALDRYTIEVRLTKPYPQLLYTFSQGYSAIVPHEAVAHYGKEFAVRPVGSGPFRVTQYDTAKIVFERNPKYRQEPVDIWAEGFEPEKHAHLGVEKIHGRSPPFVDRLEIDFIFEGAARWSSFTKGNEVQFTTVPNELVDQVLESKNPIRLRPEYAENYHMYAGLEAGFVFQAFNLDFPEFGYNEDPERERRNKALRCAIIKAFDWEGRNESFYFGLANVYPGIIVPVVPEFDASLPADSITRDVDGARQLLADNGWNADNLPELVYGATASVTSRLIFEQFRAWLKEIGYPPKKVTLKRFATFGAISKAWKESTLPWVAKGWGLDFPDAENTLQLFYGPNASPGSNDANYRNPEFDRLYEQSSVMQPGPERTALYHRMNRMVVDDCVAATGLSRTRIYLWHKDVIAMPDREIVGGFFLKYVDIEQATGAATVARVGD